ncbi:nuclear transport factor 2 family protein [Undibacterium sp. Jales W-56]|uniref:YybH family protein n=1 Tax=Undibacterium sp. Jales W-56 TaxID=2897325 RepID=UPI0021D07053|nr:nuclear transport factor 2 family protein [Undibacterium sp. Jales W-56]MCU6435068.1 nuclear transport factor 2 family protein [Undibacterium sp. Jales W-56]
MFKIITLALLSALTGLSYASEPKETLAAFYAALATGDQAKASELLAPDVTVYESGYVERSRADYAGHHLPEDIAFAKTSTRKVLQHSERIDGSLAVIWEETETRATIKDKEVRILGTETALLQKSGDAWLITHVHWSSRKPK